MTRSTASVTFSLELVELEQLDYIAACETRSRSEILRGLVKAYLVDWTPCGSDPVEVCNAVTEDIIERVAVKVIRAIQSLGSWVDAASGLQEKRLRNTAVWWVLCPSVLGSPKKLDLRLRFLNVPDCEFDAAFSTAEALKRRLAA